MIVNDFDVGDIMFYILDCNGYNIGFFEMDLLNGDVYLGWDFDCDVGYLEIILCNVMVWDKGGLIVVSSLIIIIDDVNDNILIFEFLVFMFYFDFLDLIGICVGDVILLVIDNDVLVFFSSVRYNVDMIVFGMWSIVNWNYSFIICYLLKWIYLVLVYWYFILYFLLGNDYFVVDVEGNIIVNSDLLLKFLWLEIIDFKFIVRDFGGLFVIFIVFIIFLGVSLYLIYF